MHIAVNAIPPRRSPRTCRCVMGVNLDTLRPEPTVEGYTTPGGYSYKVVLPALMQGGNTYTHTRW